MDSSIVHERRTCQARWLQTIGAGLAALPGLVLWTIVAATHPVGSGPPPYFSTLIALLWAGPAMWLAGYAIGHSRRLGDYAVDVDRHVLLLQNAIGEVRRIARSEIKHVAIGTNGELLLELYRGHEVSLALGEARTRDVLDALDLGAGNRHVVFRWFVQRDGLWGAMLGFLLPIPAFLLSPTPPVGGLILPIISGIPWLLAAWFAEFCSRRSLSVGMDGMELRCRGSVQRMHWADVRAVWSSPEGLDVVLSDGRVTHILSAHHAPELRASIARWMHDAMEHEGRRLHRDTGLPLLASVNDPTPPSTFDRALQGAVAQQQRLERLRRRYVMAATVCFVVFWLLLWPAVREREPITCITSLASLTGSAFALVRSVRIARKIEALQRRILSLGLLRDIENE